MAKRAVYHVVPADDLWVVRLVGDSVNEAANTKEAAIARAKQLAQRSVLSQVVIHRADGTIEKEYTYGEDPTRSPG